MSRIQRTKSILLLLTACTCLGAHTDQGGAQADAPAAEPTFNRDIAPIIFEHCSACHREGQAAPFSLLTFNDVKKRAGQIAQVTGDRFMPPWLPQPIEGGPAFVGERRLTDAQLAMIQRWAQGEQAEGDPHELPPVPKHPEDWPLGKPDLVLTLSEAYELPAAQLDTIRTFVFPVEMLQAEYVKCIDVRAGNSKAVHHASFLVETTASARKLDEIDPGVGYGAMADIGFNLAGSFGAWSPGGAVAPLPSGVGRMLPRQCDIVAEFHFNPTGKIEHVKPELGLYFAKEPVNRIVTSLTLGSFFVDIPAGEPNYMVESALTLPTDVLVISLAPHAHYICQRMKAWATLPDGSVQQLLRIDDWDFNWQQEYCLQQPLHLPAGSTLHMAFAYDNTVGNAQNPSDPPKRVRIGSSAADEMALLFVNVVADNHAQRMKLEDAYRSELIKRMQAARQSRQP